MTQPRLLLACAVALAASLAACTVKTDLGAACKMTRPADGGVAEIEEEKIADPKIDYVALGAAECDDLVCIRSALTSKNPPNDNKKGRGYCTKPCIDVSDCDPDYQGKTGSLRCEKLLLDEQFLSDLQKNDPETYQRTFGGGASAKYCVFPRETTK